MSHSRLFIYKSFKLKLHIKRKHFIKFEKYLKNIFLYFYLDYIFVVIIWEWGVIFFGSEEWVIWKFPENPCRSDLVWTGLQIGLLRFFIFSSLSLSPRSARYFSLTRYKNRTDRGKIYKLVRTGLCQFAIGAAQVMMRTKWRREIFTQSRTGI